MLTTVAGQGADEQAAVLAREAPTLPSAERGGKPSCPSDQEASAPRAACGDQDFFLFVQPRLEAFGRPCDAEIHILATVPS